MNMEDLTKEELYQLALKIYDDAAQYESRHKRASVRRRAMEKVRPDYRMFVDHMFNQIHAERTANKPKSSWMQDFVMKGSISNGAAKATK